MWANTHSLFDAFKVNCWPLLDLRRLCEPTQIRDRCKWSRKLLEDWQITALRGWAANIGKISFYSVVRIHNLAYVNDWGWVVEKSSWSEEVWVQKVVSETGDSRVFDMQLPGRWSHTNLNNNTISITTFSFPPNIDKMCWRNTGILIRQETTLIIHWVDKRSASH